MAPEPEHTPATATAAPERVVVKWNSPADELVGIARLVQVLVERRIAAVEDVRMVVPSANWGVQLQRACESVGLSAVFEATACAHGGTAGQAAAAPPSLTDLPPVLIVPYPQDASAWEPVGYVYAVACVDGLLPRTLPQQATDEQREAARAASRAVFRTVAQGVRTFLALSLFTSAEVTLAQGAHLRFSRTKTVRGEQLAVTHPTPFLAEWGGKRPTTLGGQALLRTHGLN